MIETLGSTQDGPFQRIVIAQDGLSATLTNAGAALMDLRHNGVADAIILGYADPSRYLVNSEFMGTLVGRVANRIAGAKAEIGGVQHRFDTNEGHLILHGGPDGAWRRLWTLADHGPAHATFTLTLPDGHMGFPGTLAVSAEYRIESGALLLSIDAETDQETLCNFASHVYYARCPETRLWVGADKVQIVDAANIPEGDPVPVTGTRFDYRSPKPVEGPIDHNLCLARHRGPLRDAARLERPHYHLHIATTEPGLQVYDGRHLDIEGGLDGAHYCAGSAVALEPQAWVDAPNREFRDQVALLPGARYRQDTVIRVTPT